MAIELFCKVTHLKTYDLMYSNTTEQFSEQKTPVLLRLYEKSLIRDTNILVQILLQTFIFKSKKKQKNI